MDVALGSMPGMPPKGHRSTDCIECAIPAVSIRAFSPQKEPMHGYHKLFGFYLLEYFPQGIGPSLIM